MAQILLWLMLILIFLTAISVAVLLFRRTAVPPDLGKEVREELRANREEARTAGRNSERTRWAFFD